MKKLNTKEMKVIVNQIISKELAIYNLEANIYPVNIFEYYTKYIPNANFENKNDFINALKMPMTTKGFTFWHLECKTEKPDIVVFIDYFKKYKNPILNLIKHCFHEAKHYIQLTVDDYDYIKFIRNLETILTEYDWDSYINCHDDFLFEIEANIYAINKTKELLKDKYPNIYQLEKDNIDNIEKNYDLDYMLYDAIEQFDKLLHIALLNKIILINTYPVFDIFLNNINAFKSINDIIKNPNLKNVDKRILYTVLSSNSFLNSVNMEKLSDIELDTLNKSLQYTYNIYINQFKFILNSFNNNAINLNYFTQIKNVLIEKIKNINGYITLLNSAKNPKQYRYEFIKKNLKNNNVEIL